MSRLVIRILVGVFLALPGIALAVSAEPLQLGDQMIVLGIFWAILFPATFVLAILVLAGEPTVLTEPARGSVDDLFAKVALIPPGIHAYEIYVPDTLTDKGQITRQDIALAILTDRILDKGLFPAGFVQRRNGRVYKYTSEFKLAE